MCVHSVLHCSQKYNLAFQTSHIKNARAHLLKTGLPLNLLQGEDSTGKTVCERCFIGITDDNRACVVTGLEIPALLLLSSTSCSAGATAPPACLPNPQLWEAFCSPQHPYELIPLPCCFPGAQPGAGVSLQPFLQVKALERIFSVYLCCHWIWGDFTISEIPSLDGGKTCQRVPKLHLYWQPGNTSGISLGNQAKKGNLCQAVTHINSVSF